MLPDEEVTRLAGSLDATLGSAPASRVEAQPARVVLDTNTVLDWLVFRDQHALAVGSAIIGTRLTWLATPRMLTELRAVLARPLASRWEPAREHALTSDLTRLAVVCAEPDAASSRLACRDATDQVFIDLALVHGPALLLTRDRALLALRRRAAAHGVDVTTAASWHQRLQHPGRPSSA